MDGFARGRQVTESFAGQTVETARRALTARFKSSAIESAETRCAAARRRGAWPRSHRPDHGRAAAAHGRRISAAGRFRASPPARRAGRAYSRPQGILGAAAKTFDGDAGAAARHRDGGRTGAGIIARRRCAQPQIAYRRSRHRLRGDPAGAVVGAAERARVRHRHFVSRPADRRYQCRVGGALRSRRRSSPAITRPD